MNTAKLILESMRPKQWAKNLFLFAGIIFALKLLEIELLFKVIAAFACFCGVSGSVYILNDILDCEKDKTHPEKCKRPIASGRLQIKVALIAFVVVLVISLLLSLMLGSHFFIVSIVYFVINVFYSFYLKNIAILDVFTIAIGFVLRAIAGAIVISVEISPWLLICTMFLSLFLALCKRRNEIVTMENNATAHRFVLKNYTPELLDQWISIMTPSTLMAYVLYTISPNVQQKFHTEHLIYTIPFVLFGIFRYLYLVHKKNLGGIPEVIILTDIPMIINMFLWVCAVLIILYLR
jgi:4-hydroxybenzoate polyprenyltransferase